jgi:hypothetical protein
MTNGGQALPSTQVHSSKCCAVLLLRLLQSTARLYLENLLLSPAKFMSQEARFEFSSSCALRVQRVQNILGIPQQPLCQSTWLCAYGGSPSQGHNKHNHRYHRWTMVRESYKAIAIHSPIHNDCFKCISDSSGSGFHFGCQFCELLFVKVNQRGCSLVTCDTSQY